MEEAAEEYADKRDAEVRTVMLERLGKDNSHLCCPARL
jgi:hypothetical protein